MDWLELESFGLDCPLLADELVGREAFEGFEPASEIVCVEEVGEVAAQLVVVLVVAPFDSRLLDCSISCSRQVLSNICIRKRAVGPFLRDGWSQNCTPLSVRTVRILYGTASMSALRKVEAE